MLKNFKGQVTAAWDGISYFGVKPVKYEYIQPDENGEACYIWLVREVDIEKLPFYDFWKESARGSTCMADEDHQGKMLIYVHDWEAFCRLFITTGRNRCNLGD